MIYEPNQSEKASAENPAKKSEDQPLPLTKERLKEALEEYQKMGVVEDNTVDILQKP